MAYLSWILWGLFGLIVLLTVFGLLAGLCKGIVKTTTKTVIKAILITVFVFTSPLIARAVGNLDVSNFAKTITVANQTIQVTTLTDTLANVLTATGLVSPMNGIALYQTAFALAYSVLSYAIFLVLMILTQILISLVTCIIYNIFIRWLVPTQSKKERREEKSFRKENKTLFILVRGLLGEHKYVKKHRLAGATLGAVQEFVFACILMMPVTSLARIAISTTKDKTETNASTKNANADLTNNYGSLYQILVTSGVIKDEDRPSGDNSNTFYRTDWDKYITQVENSLVYKMLGFGNMDKIIMDKVSVTTVNGQSMPLSDLVTGTFDVAYPLLNSKSFKFDSAATTITINYSTLLSTTTISNVINNFLSNKIIMSLLPPLIDTALNYASANTNIPLDEIDFSNVNWSDDLSALNTIYSDIYDLGIKPMIGQNCFDYKKFSLKTSTYTDADIEKIGEALSKLCQVNSVKSNLGLVFSNLSLLLHNSGFDIFPSEKSAYDNINWADNIKPLVTGVLKLFRLCELDLSYDLFNSNMNFQSADNKITKAVKNVLKDETKRKTLNGLLTGTSGIFTISLIDVCKLGDLADSVIKMIPSLRPYTVSNDYANTIKKLNNNSAELRKETDVAFKLMDILFDQKQPLNYWDIKKISESKNDSKLILSYLNDSVSNELVTIMDLAEDSSLFKSMYGSIMKTFVFQFYDSVNNKDRDYLFGLTPYDFNYDDENFLTDLKSLITLAPKLKTMYDTLNDKSLSKMQQFEALDTSTLRPFMNILANSELLNSNQISATTGKTAYNKNVETVLKNLFSLNIFRNFNITLPDLSNVTKTKTGDSPYWGDGSRHAEGEAVKGEIDALCSLIEDLQKNKEVLNDFVSKRNNLNRQTLKELLKDLNTSEERNALIDAISDAFQSEIVRPTAIEYTLQAADKFLSKYNIPYSLNDIRNFVYDRKNNAKIVEDLNNVKDLIPLLNTIDYHALLNDYRALRDRKAVDKYYFQMIDLDTINAILTTIANSNTYQFLSDSTKTGTASDGKNDILCALFYSLCQKLNVFDRQRIMIPDFSAQVLNPVTYGEKWTETSRTVTLNVVDKNSDGTQTKRTMDYKITETGALMSSLQAFYLVQNSDISTLLQKHMPKYYPDGFLATDGTENRYANAKALSNDAYFRNLMYIYGPYVVEDAITYLNQIPNGAKRLINYINWDILTDKDANGNFIFSSDDVIKEAGVLFRIAKGIKKLGVRNLKNIAKNLNKLSSDQLSTIQDMILTASKSKLLTTVRKGYDLSILSKTISSAAQYVIQKYPRAAALLKAATLDDNTATYVKTFESMLKNIDEKGWEKEFSIYAQLLGSIQGIAIRDTKNIYAQGRTYDNLHTISYLVNQSELLHKAPIGAIKIGFRKMNLNSYLKYDLDIYHHLTTSQEDIRYWQDIYDTGLDLIYHDEGFRALVGNDISNLKNFKIDNMSTSFLYYLGKIDFMQTNRSYFLLNALVKAAGEENVNRFIRPATNAPEGEDARAYQLENLFFQNLDLYKNGVLDKELALRDTKILDELLGTLVSKISKVGSAANINELYDSLKDENGNVNFFTEIMEKTMTIDENGNLVRSKLASELVAGIVNTMVHNDSLSDDFSSLMFLDFYADNYELINPIEGKAIDTLIEFLAVNRNDADHVLYHAEIEIAETTVEHEGYNVTIPATTLADDVTIDSWSFYSKSQIASLLNGLCYNENNFADEKTKKIASFFKNKNHGNSMIAKTIASAHHHEDKKTYTYEYSYTLPTGETILVPVTGSVGPFDFDFLGILPMLTTDNHAVFFKDYIADFSAALEEKSFVEVFLSLDLSTIR